MWLHVYIGQIRDHRLGFKPMYGSKSELCSLPPGLRPTGAPNSPEPVTQFHIHMVSARCKPHTTAPWVFALELTEHVLILPVFHKIPPTDKYP